MGDWAPTLNVRYVLGQVKNLLLEPNVESPLEAEIADLYSKDRTSFDAKAKAHTLKFAGP